MVIGEKMGVKEKENRLIEKIEKAKKDLQKLQEKRRIEIGRLACKYGLDGYENKLLGERFSDLAKELSSAYK